MKGRATSLSFALLFWTCPALTEPRSALILGQELIGLSSEFRFTQSELQGDLSCDAGSPQTQAEARLTLPPDTVMNAWHAWVSDSSKDGNIGLSLVERCRDADDPGTLTVRTLGTLASTAAPGDIVLSQAIEPTAAVDSACTYAIRVDFAHQGAGCSGLNRRIYQLRVDYQSVSRQAARGTSAIEGPSLRPEQHGALFDTTDEAGRRCLAESDSAYFTTRLPLPDRAVPLAAHVWLRDDDALWNGHATFRLLCRDMASTSAWLNLATLSSHGASGAIARSTIIPGAQPVDQRECAIIVINESEIGDPCVSDALHYLRMSLDYVIDPLFADAFDIAANG